MTSPKAWGYILASTGPDGVSNISLRHYMLTQALQSTAPHYEKSREVSISGPYLRLTPRGYEFSKTFAPGADLVRVEFLPAPN